MTKPVPSDRGATAEKRLSIGRHRPTGTLILRADREHRLPEEPDEPTRIELRLGDGASGTDRVEPSPASARQHRVAREPGMAPRVELDPDSIGRDRLLDQTEPDVTPVGPGRHPHGANDPTVTTGPQGGATVADPMVLVHQPGHRDAPTQGVHDTGVESLLELEARPSRPPQGQRHRESAAVTKYVDQAEPCAVAEPMALGVLQDREEHRLPCRGRQHPGPAPVDGRRTTPGAPPPEG